MWVSSGGGGVTLEDIIAISELFLGWDRRKTRCRWWYII